MGMTDQAIIRDIVAGERDPQTLARYRRGRIKASIKLVRTALTGNWREEHRFGVGGAAILLAGVLLIDAVH